MTAKTQMGLTALSILGTAIAQIVASSGSQYSIDKSYDKR